MSKPLIKVHSGDGADDTQGSQTDAAWDGGSGPATVISILKKNALTYRSENYVWDVPTLAWVVETQPGGSGGGGAVTIANGADVAQGNTADVAWVSGAGTVIALLKKIASSGGGGTSSHFGDPFPDTPGVGLGTPVGFKDQFSAMSPGSLDASGNLKVGVQGTVPISASGVLDVNLGRVSGVGVSLGQKVMTASIPVVIATDQAAVPVSAVSLPLPAGAATEAGNLAAIKADVDKIPSQGQALAAASTPVVLTALQVAALTPPAAITGFALEAGHLATIDSHTPALGQALAAASVPVILPAATITTLTPPAAIVGFALEAGHLAAIDTSTAKIPAQGQALAAASLPVVLTAAQQAALTPPAAIVGFALDTTVAKDATLATIDTDIKATQPRSITNFPATQAVSMAAGSNADLQALYTLTQRELLSMLNDIRTELRILNAVSASGLNVKDDLDNLRAEPAFIN